MPLLTGSKVYGGLCKLWLNSLSDPWPEKTRKCIKSCSPWLEQNNKYVM